MLVSNNKVIACNQLWEEILDCVYHASRMLGLSKMEFISVPYIIKIRGKIICLSYFHIFVPRKYFIPVHFDPIKNRLYVSFVNVLEKGVIGHTDMAIIYMCLDCLYRYSNNKIDISKEEFIRKMMEKYNIDEERYKYYSHLFFFSRSKNEYKYNIT